ncbi:MAG: hypothetical protein RLZZ385_1631 [Pseudomonadota bacterium]
MPVFNEEHYLRHALESLLGQTFEDFELIISDNASTDGTATICAMYAQRDSRIRVVRQPENIGAVANFQLVLEQAQGEYFMWAAADDLWSKSWLEELLAIAHQTGCPAMGTVRQMDVDGKDCVHPANGRRQQFIAPRLLRRLRFFLQPGLLGKANSIYAVYPRKLLTPECTAALVTYPVGFDLMFLYRLLGTTAIHGTHKASLRKRIRDTHVDTLAAVSKKPSLLTRAANGIRQAHASILVHQYFAESGFVERWIIVALYPIALAYAMLVSLFQWLK